MGLSQGVTIFYLWTFPKSHSNNAEAESGNPEGWRGKDVFMEKPLPILVLDTASPWRKSAWKGWATKNPNVQTARAVGEQSWTFSEHSMDSRCELPKDDAPQTGSPLTQIPPKNTFIFYWAAMQQCQSTGDKFTLALYFQVGIYPPSSSSAPLVQNRAGQMGLRKAPSGTDVSKAGAGQSRSRKCKPSERFYI